MSATKLKNRLANAQRSLDRLEEAVGEPLDDRLMNLDATVHRFNTAFETLVKALDMWLAVTHRLSDEERGRSSFALLQSAYRVGLIADDQLWVRILNARNTTVHEYNLEKAMALYREIGAYAPHLRALLDRMEAKT